VEAPLVLGNLRLALHRVDGGHSAGLVRAVAARRIAAVSLATLLLSLGTLVNPALLDFFSAGEIALAWLEHLAELAVLAAILLVVYTVLDEFLPPALPFRLVAICAVLFLSASGLAVLLYA
jgi:hypothetical protein